MMYKEDSQHRDDEAIDSLILDVVGMSEDAVDIAWQHITQEHIVPSRIFVLASNLASASDTELVHLRACKHCRTYVMAYSESETSYTSPHEDDSSGQGNGRGHCSLKVDTDEAANDMSSHTSLHATDASVPELLRELFCVDAPIVFPGNEVARSSWQFGLLATLKHDAPDLAEKALRLICDRALDAIESQLGVDVSTSLLVCFGQAMHECGIHLAARAGDLHVRSPHVVLAHDYFDPKLVCDPRELKNAHVIALIDVVHSGSLLTRLADVCRDYAPASVVGLTIIDQSTAPLSGITYCSLWRSNREDRTTIEEYCTGADTHRLEDLRCFDPNLACAFGSVAAVEATHRERPIDPQRDFVDAELQEHIHRTGAMKRDFMIGDKRYAFAVNVLDLLKKDEQSRQFVLSRTLSVLADCAFHTTCLAYHAGRARRAGVIANAISCATGWPTMPIGKRGRAFSLSDDQCRRFASFDNVVIVDAAIRTGETMTAIAEAIARERLSLQPRIMGVCILNALADSELDDLSICLGLELRSVFSLPLAPPTEEVRHWAASQKATIGRKLSDASVSEAVRTILIDYCSRRPKPSHSDRPLSADDTTGLIKEAVLHAKKDESATDRIGAACTVRLPRAIRHLSIDEVVHDRKVQNLLNGIMFNSMKPQFKESAAIALAAAGRYDWMTLEWLKCNREFLSSQSPAWKSVVMIECYMRLSNREQELNAFRMAAEEYLALYTSRQAEAKTRQSRQLWLFSRSDEEYSSCDRSLASDKADSGRVVERVNAFIQAAAK